MNKRALKELLSTLNEADYKLNQLKYYLEKQDNEIENVMDYESYKKFKAKVSNLNEDVVEMTFWIEEDLKDLL